MSKKILFIEDDPDIYEILNIVFDEEGYEVIGFRSSISLQEIALIHPDLILLDVRIVGSEKTGTEICAELKADPDFSSIPVLLLSAERGLEQIARNAGADGMISKPFGLTDLISGVKKYL